MSTISSVSNSPSIENVNNNPKGKAKTESTFCQRVYSVLEEGLSGGGLGDADIPNAMRLAPFYSGQWNDGVATKQAVAIADAGALVKNYFGVLAAPKQFAKLYVDVKGLATEELKAKSDAGVFVECVSAVSNAVTSFFVAMKTGVDGLEVFQSMGLVGKEIVTTYKPYGLMATALGGIREVLSSDIPKIIKHYGKDGTQVGLSLLKLMRNVSLVAVGSLALVAVFFKVAFAPWLIPVLLTVAVTTSVAGRFIKGLLVEDQVRSKSAAV